MKTNLWQFACVLTGWIAAAPPIWTQYTVSAKPAIVNYFEGDVYLNGGSLQSTALRTKFLNATDTVSTVSGKVEILLTPGVFLRIGDNSQINIVSASLTDIVVELTRGEAIIEAAGLGKDNLIKLVDHGATIAIDKNGLYRFFADVEPAAETLDGQASVWFGNKKIELKKGRKAFLDAALTVGNVDNKKEDELYAWSNVRSEYEAALSYKAAITAPIQMSALTYNDWYLDASSGYWAWLPAHGFFFSPFGWGFYSAGAVNSACVLTTGVAQGGHWIRTPGRPVHRPGGNSGHIWVGRGTEAKVPVNPRKPASVGVLAASPAEEHAIRTAAAQVFARSTGFGGRPSYAESAGQTFSRNSTQFSSSRASEARSSFHGNGGVGNVPHFAGRAESSMARASGGGRSAEGSGARASAGSAGAASGSGVRR